MSLRASAHTGVAPSGDSLRSQSVTPAFPAGEGGLRVPRKRETDEGHLPLPLGEVPGRGGEGFILPSQSLRDSSPRVGAKEDGLPHQ